MMTPTTTRLLGLILETCGIFPKCSMKERWITNNGSMLEVRRIGENIPSQDSSTPSWRLPSTASTKRSCWFVHSKPLLLEKETTEDIQKCRTSQVQPCKFSTRREKNMRRVRTTCTELSKTPFTQTSSIIKSHWMFSIKIPPS